MMMMTLQQTDRRAASLCVLGEVGLGSLGVGLHGICTGLPASGTHLSVLVSELEGLYQSQGLIHGATHWQVIHGDLTQVTLVINDEQASECDAVIVLVDTILL